MPISLSRSLAVSPMPATSSTFLFLPMGSETKASCFFDVVRSAIVLVCVCVYVGKKKKDVQRKGVSGNWQKKQQERQHKLVISLYVVFYSADGAAPFAYPYDAVSVHCRRQNAREREGERGRKREKNK